MQNPAGRLRISCCIKSLLVSSVLISMLGPFLAGEDLQNQSKGDPAINTLLYFQLKALQKKEVRMEWENRQKDLEVLKRRLAELPQEIKRALSRPLPTQYEDPLPYDILAVRLDSVLSGMKARELPLRPPTFGTVPAFEVGAHSFRIHNTAESLIVFNRGLFYFVHEMLKYALRPLNISRDGKVSISARPRDQKLAEGKLNQAFRATILEFLEGRQSNAYTDRYTLPDEYHSLQTTLLESLESFAVAHEVGHIFKGDEEEVVPASDKDLAAAVAVVLAGYQKELEADEFGDKILEWLSSTPEDRELAAVFRDGGTLFLKFHELLERTRELIKTGVLPPRAEDQKEEFFRVTEHPPDSIRSYISRRRKSRLHAVVAESMENVDHLLQQNAQELYRMAKHNSSTK
jgi:hypothetical protein